MQCPGAHLARATTPTKASAPHEPKLNGED
jgi:hypothetical protein